MGNGNACCAAPADPDKDWVMDIEDGNAWSEMLSKLRSGDEKNLMPSDVNITDDSGFTALHRAISALDGLKAGEVDDDRAAMFDVLDFIREVIKKFGAEVNNNANTSKLTPLHIAVTIQDNNATACYHLIKEGFSSKGHGGPINVDRPNNQGGSAKSIAAKNDSGEAKMFFDGKPVKVWVYDENYEDMSARYVEKTVTFLGDDNFEVA